MDRTALAEQATQLEPRQLIERLRQMTPEEAAAWFGHHRALPLFLDPDKSQVGRATPKGRARSAAILGCGRGFAPTE